jgi:lipoprotein NlpI
MLGYIDATRLLESARASDPKEVAWHTCEATFYASQVARVAGRTDEEMKYLDQCVATDQPDVAEFWVAKFRLARLRPTKNAAPEKQRTGSAPTI